MLPLLPRVALPRLAEPADPGPLGREAAREAARAELARREYADAQPPLLLRLVGRALRFVNDLFADAAARVGDGTLARVLVLGLLALAVGVVLTRLGPVSGRRGGRAVFDGSGVLTAAQHRSRAAELAAAGRHPEAVRERLRAVVRELESRGVIDRRPGRTATEVATDAGLAVPRLADPLHAAARLFDEVWYGGRAAGPQDYDGLVRLDEQVCGVELVRAGGRSGR